MEKEPVSHKWARAALGVAAALLLAAAGLGLYLARDYTLAGGWLLSRESVELDLRDLEIRSVGGLLRLRAPQSIDLRGSSLKVRQYRRLARRFPDCDIRWDVPLGEARYDSASLSLELSAPFEPGEAENFDLFPRLREVNAAGLDCYEALAVLTAARPDLTVRWDIALGGRRFAHDASELRLSAADARAGELMERLAYFDALTALDISGAALTTDEQAALLARYPSLSFRWEVETVCNLFFSSDTAELNLAGYGGFSLAELLALRPFFPRLELIDLTGCGFSNEDLLTFREDPALDGVDVRWTFKLCGASVCTTDSEVDLSGHPVEDVSEVEDALFYFPRLEKVVMCDCGVSDEEMDALDKRHEDIRFVWMVHFGDFFLRTDATTFIATTFPYGYTYLTNEQLQPLQYCRDLIALDLGHMYYSDVSFLTQLTKLQYLILADTNISDISMLAEMEDLYYLEIFLTQVKDISPLLSCRNLRHLNISFCPIENTEVLSEMTWLERLWAPGVNFTYASLKALRENLADTEINLYSASSTGGTWRTDPAYYEMRDVFGAHYMSG